LTTSTSTEPSYPCRTSTTTSDSNESQNSAMSELKVWCRGRCYDHKFLQFSPFFLRKIGVFLKNQCYDPFFKKIAIALAKKRRKIGDNIYKIITSSSEIQIIDFKI
jgi:hypothetical protein